MTINGNLLPNFNNENLTNLIKATLVAIGLSLSFYGIRELYFYGSLASSNVQNNNVSSRSDNQSCDVIPEDGKIHIDISGAVYKSGIYQVDDNSLVGEVIASAGGFLKDADKEYINKNLNLAKKVKDGEKIYIPFLQEKIDRSLEVCLATLEQKINDSSNNSDQNTTKISVNNASISELETLDGIGAKRAESIVANRPYSSLNELVDKKVLSPNLFTQIEKEITL